MSEAKKSSSAYYIHVAIVILLMFFFKYLPAPAPVTPYGMNILGIFIGLIYGWSLCGLAWPSVLAMVALGLSEYGITESVFALVFGQANLVLMIFGFMVFAPLGESGLTEYMGNKLLSIKFMQGRPLVMIGTLFAGVLVIALTGINGYLLMFFMMTVFLDVFKKLGYQKGDRFIPMFLCGIFMQTAFANLLLPFMPLVVMIYGTAGITDLNNSKYLLFGILFVIIADLVLVALFKILHLNLEPLYNVDYEEMAQKAKEPLNKRQKALLMSVLVFLGGMLIVGLFSSPTGNVVQQFLAKVGVYGVIAIVVVLMMVVKIDGKELLPIHTLTTGVNWNITLLYAMAMTMSTVLTSAETGISSLVIAVISPILATLSEYWFLLLIGAVTLILTNIGNNMVVIFTMVTVVKMMMGAGMAINGALAVAIILFSGLSTGYLLPSASVSASLIFGSEMNTPKSALLQGITVIIVWMLLLALVMVPLGRLLL